MHIKNVNIRVDDGKQGLGAAGRQLALLLTFGVVAFFNPSSNLVGHHSTMARADCSYYCMAGSSEMARSILLSLGRATVWLSKMQSM